MLLRSPLFCNSNNAIVLVSLVVYLVTLARTSAFIFLTAGIAVGSIAPLNDLEPNAFTSLMLILLFTAPTLSLNFFKVAFSPLLFNTRTVVKSFSSS